MIQFSALRPDFQLYDLGFLPEMLSLNDPRPAKEQLDGKLSTRWWLAAPERIYP